MKYPKERRDELVADIKAVAKLLLETNGKTLADIKRYSVWVWVHEVNAQRSYGDDHPRWATIPRVLPPSHVDGQCWLNGLYNEHELDDSHIQTAAQWAVNKIEVDAIAEALTD